MVRNRQRHLFTISFLAIILIIVSISLFLLWHNRNSHQINPQDNIESYQLEGWAKEHYEILTKVYEIAGQGSTTSFLDAVDYLNSQIEITKDESQRFDLTLDLIGLYASEAEDPETALKYLQKFDETTLSTNQKTYLYSAYSRIYRMMDQTDIADEYLEKFYATGELLTKEANE